MVQLHQFGPMDWFVQRTTHLHIRLQIFFDDFGVDADRDNEDALVEVMVEAADNMAQAMEGDMGCELALKKGGIASNSDAVARRLAGRISDLPATVHKVLKTLGIDAAAGRARGSIKLVTQLARRGKAGRRPVT